MDEDVVAPGHSPELEPESLDEAPHILEGDVVYEPPSQTPEQSLRIHGRTIRGGYDIQGGPQPRRAAPRNAEQRAMEMPFR